jgi:hypothetical protein
VRVGRIRFLRTGGGQFRTNSAGKARKANQKKSTHSRKTAGSKQAIKAGKQAQAQRHLHNARNCACPTIRAITYITYRSNIIKAIARYVI